MRTRKLIVIVLALIVAIDVVLLCAGGPDGAAAANPTTYQGVDTEQPVVPVNTTQSRFGCKPGADSVATVGDQRIIRRGCS
ncbi:MAG: hypothetical protein R2867_03315 [Caldilineaceae bacterium]